MSESMDMPDFTICNFHRFDDEKLREYNVSPSLADYLQNAAMMDTPYTAFLPNYTKNESEYLEMELRSLVSTNDNLNLTIDKPNLWIYKLLEKLGFTCSQLFKYCVVGGQERNCCDGAGQVVTEQVVTRYGICYTVSTEPQRWPGYGNGLSVIMNTYSSVTSRVSNLLLNKGVLVIPTEKTSSYLSHAYGIAFFSVGTHSAIALSASKLELDGNEGSCYNLSDTNVILKSLNVTTDVAYSVTVCQHHCKAKVVRDQCQCIPVAPRGFQTLSEATPYCTPDKIVACGHAAIINGSKDLDQCRALCKPTCHHWDYSITSTSAALDHTAMKANRNALKINTTEDLVVLEFFYNSLQYSAIVHQKFMTIEDVIGVVGGQLSLCTGMSFLSFVQMGVYLIRMFLTAIHHHVINI